LAPRRIVKSRLVTAQDRVRGLMCTIALSSSRSGSRSLYSSICRLSMDNATVCVWSSADGRRHSRCIVALNALVHQVQTPARPRSDVCLINIPSGWRSTGCCLYSRAATGMGKLQTRTISRWARFPHALISSSHRPTRRDEQSGQLTV